MGERIPRRQWIFVLTLAAAYFAFALRWQDFSLYDELLYMDSGAGFHLRSLTYFFDYGPLYAMWYQVLELFFRQPIVRYFASWVLLVTLILIVPLCMRIRSAWLYAWLLLCVPFFGISNFAIEPYVALFAALLLAIGGCYVRSRNLQWTEVAFGAFTVSAVTAFCRPEFAYGAILSALLYFVLALKLPAPGTPRKRARQHAFVATFCLLLVAIVHRYSNGRSGVAFAQHYNIWAQEHNLLRPGEDPWTSDYALRLFGVDVGKNAGSTTATIDHFFKANPRLFMAHVFANLRVTMTIAFLIFLVLALALPWVMPRARALRPISLFALLMSIPTILATLLIFPAEHYFIIPTPLLLLFVCECFGVGSWRTEKILPWLGVLALPLIVVSTISLKTLKQGRVREPHPNLDTVECLRSLEQSQSNANATMLDAMGIPAVILHRTHRRLEFYDFQGYPAFTTLIETERPSFVEMTPMVAGFYRQPESTIDQFLQAHGYTPHPCPSAPDQPLTVYLGSQ